MSTRANIILKDEHDLLYFYRHSDGYPEGALPTLKQFLALVKKGKIRDNVGQAAGWLIALGREEYNQNKSVEAQLTGTDNPGMAWKVGSIEPTTCRHGDIEWLYTIDLVAKTITKEHV